METTTTPHDRFIFLKDHKKAFIFGFAAVLLVALVVGLLVGALRQPQPKTFTTAGMQITLTDGFKESKPKNFTMCYGAKDMAIYTLKEAFTLTEGFENNTVEEYTSMLLKANEITEATDIRSEDGLCYFERSYTNAEGVPFHYFCFSFKAPDAFWSIQFAVHEEDAESLRSTVFAYAKSVSFPG